jgi:hypothetical protein
MDGSLSPYSFPAGRMPPRLRRSPFRRRAGAAVQFAASTLSTSPTSSRPRRASIMSATHKRWGAGVPSRTEIFPRETSVTLPSGGLAYSGKVHNPGEVRMKMIFAGSLAIALAANIAQPRTALAWGDDGHKVVALIAQSFLDADVRKRVLCHEHGRSTRRCATVREMEEGPSSSAIRC